MLRSLFWLLPFFLGFCPVFIWAQVEAPSPTRTEPLQLEAKDPPPVILETVFQSKLDSQQKEILGKKPTLEQLVGAMTPEQKSGAKTKLAEMEVKTSDPKVLAQIAHGYDLLKEPGDMARIGDRIQKLDPRGSHGYAVSATAFAQMNEYGQAQSLAAEALKRNPRDASALAIVKLYGDRGGAPRVDLGKLPNPGAPPTALEPSASPVGRREDSNLPIKLPIKVSQTNAPPPIQGSPTGGQDSENYISKGAKRPGGFENAWNFGKNLWSFHHSDMASVDAKKLSHLEDSLSATPTGERLVKELGGWKQIERETIIKYADTAQSGNTAYARPLFDWEKKKHPDKKYALVLKSDLKDKPDAEVAPVFAHELTHVRDYKKFPVSEGLSIPSEFGAHKTQVYVFEEMKGKIAPDELKRVEKDPLWQAQKFDVALWEDKILQKYPTAEQFKRQFAGVDYPDRAERAYKDLQAGVIRPGSPQLDFHVKDIYDTLTYESDIADVVKTRAKSKDYRADRKKRDEILLEDRRAMMDRMDGEDDAYRIKNGFVIEESKTKKGK